MNSDILSVSGYVALFLGWVVVGVAIYDVYGNEIPEVKMWGWWLGILCLTWASRWLIWISPSIKDEYKLVVKSDLQPLLEKLSQLGK